MVEKQMKAPDASTQPARKLVRKLKKARTLQSKIERKVGKLRTRLESAELKLAKRSQRVGLLEARAQPVSAGEHADERTSEKTQFAQPQRESEQAVQARSNGTGTVHGKKHTRGSKSHDDGSKG